MSFGNNVTQGRKKTDEVKSILTKQTVRERLLYKKFGVMPSHHSYQPFYPAPYPRHYYSPPYLYRRLPPRQVPSNTAFSHPYGAFPFDLPPRELPFSMPPQTQSLLQPQFQQPYFYMGQPPYPYGTAMPINSSRPFLPPPFYLATSPDAPYGTMEPIQYPYSGPGYVYRPSPVNTTSQPNTMATLKPLKYIGSDPCSIPDKKESDTDTETDLTAIPSLLVNPPSCWHRPPISPVDHVGEPIGTLTIITKKISNINEFEEAFPSILSSFDIGSADWEEFISGLNNIISNGNQKFSAYEKENLSDKKVDFKEEEHISLWNNYFFLPRGICIQSGIDDREYMTVYAI